jgi:UDP-N-acetylglucosamine diphosphorylase/glucosamine-1-phosphate N-acetyltransferase
MHVVVFEDSHWAAFAPLSLSRPTFSLATGCSSLLAKQIFHLRPTRLSLWVRPEMEAFCNNLAQETAVPTQINRPLDGEPAFLIDGRTAFSKPIEVPAHEAVAVFHGRLAQALVCREALSPNDAIGNSDRWKSLLKLPQMPVQGSVLQSPVDVIYWNDRSVAEDFSHSAGPGAAKVAGPYHLVNEPQIWLGRDVVLSPGCVLDASKGPVVLGAGATIGANAVVEGPCYIGGNSAVAPLAVIRPGTTVGPGCKVGGEISASIFLANSNKGHEGFLGHSYLGEWVNLGAGTTTSNLKNTYGNITLKRGQAEIETGRQFLGSLIGDHSKTSILTRLMGGTYVGYCSMLAGSIAAARCVPSFTFWTDQKNEAYKREKAIEVASRVFARRKRPWTDADERMMDYVASVCDKVEA